MGPLWAWSHGSWINNYLWNHYQSEPVTTKVVSSNPVHGEVYSIQHYVIKFVSDLRFSPVSFTNKANHHDITEILIKVALNTITMKKTTNV
jgi:hypothetical protein